MVLKSQRNLEKLRDVLRDPGATGPDPAYWVFSEVSKDKWMNLTIIQAGDYKGEFPKTYGHYHPDDAEDEIYHIIEGEGVLQLQKKHIENGKLVPEMVDEVYLVRAKAGDEIIIKNYMGHAWSNLGKTPLLSFDNWRDGHDPSDYEPIQRMHGLAYYLIDEDGEVKAKPNPSYRDLPEPKWLTASEFSKI